MENNVETVAETEVTPRVQSQPTPQIEKEPPFVSAKQEHSQTDAPDQFKQFNVLREQMANEIAALKSELQKSNIKSALAERRLVPMDADLVSKMIVDKIGSGMNPDQACASLYQSHPYLFKNTATAQVSDVAKAEEEKVQKGLNDRLIKSVVERLRRDPVQLDTQV